MPLYEERTNAVNRIPVPERVRESLVAGTDAVAAALAAAMAARRDREGRAVSVAIDGWMGADFPDLARRVEAEARRRGMPCEVAPTRTLYRSEAERQAYKKPFVGDDPAFGCVNDKGRLEDVMDPAAVNALRGRLDRVRNRAGNAGLIVSGPGADLEALSDAYDLRVYVDYTRQPLLWQMWDGKLVPLGDDRARRDYGWKEYYYCDFYLLDRHKNGALERMDFYVDGVDPAALKLVPRAAYDALISVLVTCPVKEVKIFQPGPWGAYRYRDLWNVPGLECNAWNELAGPELSMLVDVGAPAVLNMPFTNLLQGGEKLVGPAIHRELPGMFPLDVWLDDGYFPEPAPAERISMPIHNHPSTRYVKRKFNEPLGRYETYYICEAYEGANTWMGYLEDADFEAWEEACRASERTRAPIPDWKKYIANHDSNVGDLYLIPPGTTHGHGGHQMVLEMDTVPSVAGTEYSFFMYDFCRPSWDDAAKSMTGKPVKLHLDHGFDADQCRREEWVRKVLRAKPKVVKWTKDFVFDRYSSYGPMPFEIERFHFYKRAVHDTRGRTMIIPTLTVGDRVLIRSLEDPARATEIDRFQSCVIPACFGPYEMVNLSGGQATLTQIRWKKDE